MKKVLLMLLVFALVFTTGCGEDVTPAKSEGATESPQEQQENPAVTENQESGDPEPKEPVQTEFKIGEHVDIGDLTMVLNSVHTSKGEGFNTPDDGNIFYVADFTVYNESESIYSLSSFWGFEGVDNENYNYDVSWMYDSPYTLDANVIPGMKINGEVAFEIPEGTDLKEIVFDYNMFGHGQAIFITDPEQAIEETYNFDNTIESYKSIGETIETSDGRQIIVNSFYETKGEGYNAADEGQKYVYADMTIKNNSDGAINLATIIDSSLYDHDTGHYYSASIMADTKGSLSGELGSGREARGEVAFEVIESESNFYLVLENMATDQVGLVRLSE